MSFELDVRRTHALFALMRAKDGLPSGAFPAEMPMLVGFGFVAAKPASADGSGKRVWKLTMAGRRAVEELREVTARIVHGGPKPTVPQEKPAYRLKPSQTPFRF